MNLKEIPEKAGFKGTILLTVKEILWDGKREFGENKIVTAIATDVNNEECYFHFWNEQISVAEKLSPGDIFAVKNGYCKGSYNERKDISAGKFGKVWIQTAEEETIGGD